MLGRELESQGGSQEGSMGVEGVPWKIMKSVFFYDAICCNELGFQQHFLNTFKLENIACLCLYLF